MHKPTLAAVLLVVALSACSGDDDDDPTTRPTTEVSDPPSVTTEPVDPTDPTDSPTTTDPTTTTNTSTTTSTTVPTPTVEEQIAADYQLIYDGYWACLRAPLNCDLSWLVPGSESATGDEQHDAGPRRPRPLCRRGGSRLLRDRVDHRRPDGTTAEVVSCWSSDRRVVWPTRRRLTPSRPRQPGDPRQQHSRQRPSDVIGLRARGRSLASGDVRHVRRRQRDENQCAPEA